MKQRSSSNDDGKTITIKTRGSKRSYSAPEVEFIDTKERPENRIKFAIEDFIRRNHRESFRLDTHNDKAIELLLNVDKTNNNNITFKPLTTRNRRGNPEIVLKRDSKGVLQHNDEEM